MAWTLLVSNVIPSHGATFMSQLNSILAERKTTHGNFADNASYSQDFKEIIQNSLNYQRETLSDMQREALDMIVHKIARILAGNPNHRDSWDDIAGYATLVSNSLAPRSVTSEEQLKEILAEVEKKDPICEEDVQKGFRDNTEKISLKTILDLADGKFPDHRQANDTEVPEEVLKGTRKPLEPPTLNWERVRNFLNEPTFKAEVDGLQAVQFQDLKNPDPKYCTFCRLMKNNPTTFFKLPVMLCGKAPASTCGHHCECWSTADDGCCNCGFPIPVEIKRMVSEQLKHALPGLDEENSPEAPRDLPTKEDIEKDKVTVSKLDEILQRKVSKYLISRSNVEKAEGLFSIQFTDLRKPSLTCEVCNLMKSNPNWFFKTRQIMCSGDNARSCGHHCGCWSVGETGVCCACGDKISKDLKIMFNELITRN